MRHTTGSLDDLTIVINEAITELGAPTAPADGTLPGATTTLNALLAWYGSAITPADGTLINAIEAWNLFVYELVDSYYLFMVDNAKIGTSIIGPVQGFMDTTAKKSGATMSKVGFETLVKGE